jgi:hypothetical protein
MGNPRFADPDENEVCPLARRDLTAVVETHGSGRVEG